MQTLATGPAFGISPEMALERIVAFPDLDVASARALYKDFLTSCSLKEYRAYSGFDAKNVLPPDSEITIDERIYRSAVTFFIADRRLAQRLNDAARIRNEVMDRFEDYLMQQRINYVELIPLKFVRLRE